jgi:uncharacterized protein
MFNKNFNTIFCFELADEARIPFNQQAWEFAQKSRKYTDQSSLAIPRSLQQRINALLLQASVAVGMPAGSKYSCSPRAIATSLAP